MKRTRGCVLSCYWGKIKRRYDSTRDRCPDYYCYFPSQFPHAPLTSFPRGRNISPIIWHKKSQLPKQKNTTVILTFFSNLELELWRCKTRPRACQCFSCWLLQCYIASAEKAAPELMLGWNKNDAKLAQGKSCTWLYFQLNWGIYLQLYSYHNFHT